MTQFALIRLRHSATPQMNDLAELPESGLMREAAIALFGNDHRTWLIAPMQRPFDDVYLEAQKEIAADVIPKGTALFSTLAALRNDATSMALWYGGEFANLPATSNWDEFCNVIRRDLTRPSYESYVAWHAPNPR